MMGVMCCGCSAFLAVDGKTVKPFALDMKTGLVPQLTLPGNLVDEFAAEKVAFFDTVAQADAAALEKGWTIKDDDGPNHRCPDCSSKKRREYTREQRGAYVDHEVFRAIKEQNS